MGKYHQVTEKKENGGWSDYQAPIPDKYKMACCDCGLVHDLEFIVAKVVKNKKDGYFDMDIMPTGTRKGKFRVLMRARRNKRATAAMRRGKRFKDKA